MLRPTHAPCYQNAFQLIDGTLAADYQKSSTSTLPIMSIISSSHLEDVSPPERCSSTCSSELLGWDRRFPQGVRLGGSATG